MARKDIGEMKRASGFQGDLWNRFVNELIARKGSADLLFGADEQTLDAAARAAVAVLVGNSAPGTIEDAFVLTVNYGQPLAELVAAGKYNYANPNITGENFPNNGATVDGMHQLDAFLVHLGRNASDDEVLRELDRLGLRPATMRELATFGATYPDVQRKYPIVALGSVWAGPSGCRPVGYLWGDADDRRLNLGFLGGVWRAYYRFLAVRK